MHIRDMDYQTLETSLNPRAIIGFDIATGPDRDVNSQNSLLILCVVAGDRGVSKSVSLPTKHRYRMKVTVSANSCPAENAEFEVWIEKNLIMCVTRTVSGVEVL
jgi:hypothetical protein